MEHLSSEMEQHNQDQQVQWRRDKFKSFEVEGHIALDLLTIIKKYY